MRWPVVAALVVVVLAVAAGAWSVDASGRPPSPGTAAESLLRAYAPELRLGHRVRGDVRRRLRLAPSPYLGLRDSSFRGTDGVRDLGVRVDEYVDDGAPRVSWRARVAAVYLQVPDARTAARIEARARRALGAPAEICYAMVLDGVVVRRLWWVGANGRGVVLTTTVGELPDGPRHAWQRPVTIGSGRFGIGAEPPLDAWSDYVRPADCRAHRERVTPPASAP